MKIFFVLLVAVVAQGQENWPQFRGPGARGVADGTTFPERWSATENIAWKADLPGRGWSSPVVWGKHIFLTTVINRGVSEAPKKGLYLGGNRPQPPASVHEWWVYCFDLDSGKVRWKEKVQEGPPPSAIHIKNSYASETPVTDGERVYFYFGNVGVFTFDLDGKRAWSKPMEPHATRYGWGTASSPALHGDRLYIVNDNEDQSFLLALDDVMRTTEKFDTTFSPMGKDMVRPAMLAHLETVKKLTIAEKIQFWREVMQYAHDRGIEVYWFTWNIFVWGADGKHGITTAQTNRTTIDYTRKSVRELFLTYPRLAGVGITAGENMHNLKGEFADERWLWQTYGEGIRDVKKLQPSRLLQVKPLIGNCFSRLGCRTGRGGLK
jgi:hypothetical protein